MNNRRAKHLRRMATGDPDYSGRIFAREENTKTWMLHPLDPRKQYQEAKKQDKRRG
jgi:hypothetical protein